MHIGRVPPSLGISADTIFRFCESRLRAHQPIIWQVPFLWHCNLHHVLKSWVKERIVYWEKMNKNETVIKIGQHLAMFGADYNLWFPPQQLTCLPDEELEPPPSNEEGEVDEMKLTGVGRPQPITFNCSVLKIIHKSGDENRFSIDVNIALPRDLSECWRFSPGIILVQKSLY